MKRISSLLNYGFCALLFLGAAIQLKADDKKIDPTGTWTWTTPGRNGGPDRKTTLKLKLDGDKLTGKVSGGGQGAQSAETEIKDGKVKDDEISFTITREVNGNTFTRKYKGKLSGDTIKGKSEFERNGENQSRDWEAKRETEKK